MNFSILLLFFTCFWNINTACEFLVAPTSNWQERMAKYCALSSCQYCITSEYYDSFEWYTFNEYIEKPSTSISRRLQFFAIAEDNINIILSPTKFADTRIASVYRIAIGEKSNTVTYISNPLKSKYLKYIKLPFILRKNEPNEIHVEIFTDGKINVTINRSIVIEAHDPNPIEVKYFSFGAWDCAKEYFFGCKVNNIAASREYPNANHSAIPIE